MAYEFEFKAIYPWYLAIAVLISFITLAVSLGLNPLVEMYGIIVYLIFGILILVFTIPFWMNTLFRKFVVRSNGIEFKRSLNLKIPFLYEFDPFYSYEDLEWVKAKRVFVDIKGKALSNPRWVIVRNPNDFVEVVKKYAPELVSRG